MSRWRIAVLAVLVVVPFACFAGFGAYQLWQQGRAFYAWCGMAACLITAYVLSWHWQRKNKLVRPIDFTAPLHWTDRDQQAWRLVEARAKQAAEKLDPNQMEEFSFYANTAQEMAGELARFYHPGSRDPMGPLTIPEILTVIELAAHDLAAMVNSYLPGGHLLTINDYRLARQATDWYRSASNAYWMVSALFSPINTGVRYAAAHLGMSYPWQMLQKDLLAWFHTAYVHRLGHYLIELNSGRLKIGAKRYQELLRDLAPLPAPTPAAPTVRESQPPPDPAEDVRRVTLTIFGQVKAGKSSTVNAVLGEERARTSVVPATAAVTRYEVQPPGVPTRLVLLDTVGYRHTDATTDQLPATAEAARQSDLLLLVLHARNPARQADLDMLRALRGWFAARPELKMPPILGVMTHIDLLSPALEWQPPYDWNNPQRLKEKQIAEAVAAVREQLGEFLVGVVPLCVAKDKVYGVEEWLLPAVAGLLDQARAVALLRVLRAEADTGKVRKVFDQLLTAGVQALKLYRQSAAR